MLNSRKVGGGFANTQEQKVEEVVLSYEDIMQVRKLLGIRKRGWRLLE